MPWEDVLIPLAMIALAAFFLEAFSGPLFGLQIEVNP